MASSLSVEPSVRVETIPNFNKIAANLEDRYGFEYEYIRTTSISIWSNVNGSVSSFYFCLLDLLI